MLFPWNMLRRSLFVLLTCLILGAVYQIRGAPARAQDSKVGSSGDGLTLAMFIPRNDPFWDRNVRYASAAAQDLGVKLEVINFQDDPALLFDNVERVCQEGVNGIIFQSFGGIGEHVLRIAEQHQVPSFMINTTLGNPDFPPRTKYQYWVGQMTPDDFEVGATLMQQLLSTAGAAGLTNFNILAIEGRPDQEASIQRRKGLEGFIKYAPRITSFTLVPGNWDPAVASELFKKYYAKNQSLNIVWCANDNMALAVADAVDELGIEGTVFIGGVDWDPLALKAIGENRMAATSGGHFIEGAWAVILLHDYLKGLDFATEGLTFTTPMPVINKANLDSFSYFLALNPDEMDFKDYSKVYNRKRTKYTLDLTKVAGQVFGTKYLVNNQPDFTPEEKEFLRNHPKISIGVMNAWPPLNFIDHSGRPSGLGADYIRALNQRLDGVLEITPGPFVKSLEQVKARELDALMDVTPKPEREEFLNFTQPYLTIPHVIVARHDGPYYASEADLGQKTMALEKGFGNVKYFQENYPDVKIKEYANTALALDAVARGRADVYAGNQAVAVWLMEKELISNLQVQARLRKNGSILAIGVRKDWPELASILDKTLASLSAAEVSTIRRQWAGLDQREELLDQLTTKETAFIKSHPKIRLGVDTAWAPFDFLDDRGRHSGISSDYIKIICGKLGVETVPAHDRTWADMIEEARAGRIDVISAVMPTTEREDYLLFTKPYLKAPLVIITREDANIIQGIEDIKNTRTAVVKGFAAQELLEKDHPELNLMPVDDLGQALRAVSEGEAEAAIDAIAAVEFAKRRLDLTNLKVAATTPYTVEISMGVRKDWPELVSILNKGLGQFTGAEREIIGDKWVNVLVEKRTDWAAVWRVGLLATTGALVILVVILWWNRRLAQEIRERTVAEQKIQAMSSAIHDALIMIDSQSRVMYWNHAAESMFGIPSDAAMGRDMHSLFAPVEYQERARAGLDVFTKTGQGPVVGRLSELTALRANGSVFPVEVGVSAFQVGQEWFAVGTVRDITERKQIEEQVKAAREELLLIFDNSQVGIMFMHGDCVLIRANRGLADILGYDDPQEMIELDMSHLHLNEEHFKAFKSSNHEVLLRGEQSRTECRLKKRDGSAVWCSMSGKAVDTARPPDLGKGVIWVVDDITERKKAEALILESEKKIRAMSSAIHDALIMIDSESKVMFWNQAAEKIFGYSAREAMGQNMHELFVPEELRESAARGLKRFAETGRGHVVGSLLELTALRRDGTLFPVEVAVSPFQLDETWYAVGTVRDITEKKQDEELLQESQSRLDIALTSSNTGLWDWYPLEGRDYHNDQWYRQLGYTREEFAQGTDHLMELMHPEDVPVFQKAIEEYSLKKINDYAQEFRMKAKDGSWKWILSMGRVLERNESNQPRRIVGVHLDMTERKLAEQELKKHLDELERFNRLVVGRELKMIELKKEVNDILKRSGNGEKYKIVE